MPGFANFLWGGPAALVAAAAAFAAALWATRRPALAWSAGVVAGFAAGAVALSAHANGWAAAGARLANPVEAHDGIPLIALAACAPAALAAIAGRRWTLWLWAAPLAALAPLWLLWGGRYFPDQEMREIGFADEAWGAGQAVAILSGVAASIVVAWWAWRRSNSPSLPLFRSALTTVALGGAALTVAATGSITYAQLLALLAVAVAAGGACGRLMHASAGPEAAAGPILVTTGMLLVLAVCYSELNLWQAAALAAVITASAARLPIIDNRPPLAAGALRAALVLLPLAAIAGHAAAELAASQLPNEATTESEFYRA